MGCKQYRERLIMGTVTFLVELPPPFGGVTVKNQLILSTVVSPSDQAQIIDFCEIKRRPETAFSIFAKMVRAFRHSDSIVYGFGSHKRLKQALMLQKLIGGRDSLKKTTNVVMGGRFQEYLKEDDKLCGLLSDIRVNFVETEGMKTAFSGLGLKNTVVFPNARSSYGSKEPTIHDKPLRCVFFSKICEEKGVGYILSEVKNAKGITIDFYGHVDNDIKEKFDQFINSHSFAHYNGVFDAAKDNVYTELNQYDVLLLPTKWRGEGVPGILVESKMAGITAIVSDLNYNTEIVVDGIEGVVLHSMGPGALMGAIIDLAENRETLMLLKEGAFQSKARYAMETYSDQLRMLFGLEE